MLDSMLTQIRQRIDQLERHIERTNGRLETQRAWRTELVERAEYLRLQIAEADERIAHREFQLRQSREILENQHYRLRELGIGTSDTLPQ